jgi:mannose-6-phosphate isomerase-like protein (cupin superfamily)
MTASRPRYRVERLRSGSGTLTAPALAEVFQAPWREVSLVTLDPGASFGGRDLQDSEALLFVTAGRGEAALRHGPVALREGISLTLFMGERLELHAAASEGLEFFFVEVGSSTRDDDPINDNQEPT